MYCHIPSVIVLGMRFLLLCEGQFFGCQLIMHYKENNKCILALWSVKQLHNCVWSKSLWNVPTVQQALGYGCLGCSKTTECGDKQKYQVGQNTMGMCICIPKLPKRHPQELETETASGRSWLSAQPTGSHSDLCPKHQTKEFFSSSCQGSFAPLPSMKEPQQYQQWGQKDLLHPLCCWDLWLPCQCQNPMSQGWLETHGTIPHTH